MVRSALALAYTASMLMAAIGIFASPGVIGHTEHLESVLYVMTVGVFLVVSILLASRRLDSLTPGHRAILTGANLVAVTLVLAVGRLLFTSGGSTAMRASFVVGAATIGLANLVALPLLSGRRWRLDLTQYRGLTLLGLLFLGLFALFAPASAYHLHELLTTLVLGLDLAFLLVPRVSAPRLVSRAADVTAIVLIVLLASDVNAYGDEHRLDQDFYLGPVNAVLHGNPMLVTTFAQYGVGVMYFLAAIFKVIPLGYGGFQLVNSVMTCIEFVLIYCVLRLACRDQRLAIVGIAVCLVANLLTGIEPVVDYASTGPLRFGPTWLLIFLAVARASARPGRRAAFNLSLAVLVAIAAVWSFETFIYTFSAIVAVDVLEAALGAGSPRERLARALRRVALVVATAGASQIVFALLTRAFAGAWPDWGSYLAYVRLYGWEGYGDLLIETWSPGFLIAALYVISIAALVFVVATRPAFAGRNRVPLIAISGATAYGIASFTYFIGRSHPNNLHHIAPPAIVVVVIWVGLMTEAGARWPTRNRAIVVACACWAAAALGANIALQPATVFHGVRPLFGPGVDASFEPIRRLADEKPDNSRSVTAARLVNRYAPGQRQAVVVLGGGSQTATLIRVDRANPLPIVDPLQDALLPARTLSRIDSNLARLEPGATLVTLRSYLRAESPTAAAALPGSLFGQPDRFQITVLSKILEGFRYRVRLVTHSGLVVIRLESRRKVR